MWKIALVYGLRLLFCIMYSFCVVILIGEVWTGEFLVDILVSVVVGGTLIVCVWSFGWQIWESLLEKEHD